MLGIFYQLVDEKEIKNICYMKFTRRRRLLYRYDDEDDDDDNDGKKRTYVEW